MLFSNLKPSIIFSLIFIIIIAIIFQNNCINGICTIIKPNSSNNIKTILISIIWGIGLSTLYKKSYKNGACVIVNRSINDIINDKIYHVNGRCYSFKKINC